jgi:glycosyltransferase involved in cell wall biosynthesis
LGELASRPRSYGAIPSGRVYSRAVAKPDVSVVIPTRNRDLLLERLLESLRTQTLGSNRFEVVVVDDGSTDTTKGVLRQAKAWPELDLKVIRRENGGPARARNDGWRAATAPLIAFTDDDCVVTSGWLEALLEAGKSTPGTVIQGRTEIHPDELPDVGPFSRTLEIKEPTPFYATCNVLYPRTLLEALGGFDERYPDPGGEDTDLAWRAFEDGAVGAFAPDAVAYHGVVQYGPLGKLRWALHWTDSMQVFRRHPGLRSILTWGIFWKRTHALFAVAVLGAMLARRAPLAALLVLPYLRMLRARCIVDGFSLAYMPYLALYDATEFFATARGGIRHRVLIL